MKVLCAGHLVRHPVGGHTWHHLQYLVGLQRLGHDVQFVENSGWENSCYDPSTRYSTDDPTYGLNYMADVFARVGLSGRLTYLKRDGTTVGMTRDALADCCRASDVFLNLSNVNWVPEFELCRRRALVDTDPVFTQIGGFGMSQAFDRHHVLFTYGANVHGANTQMPTAGRRWFPTRQPVVLDLWPVKMPAEDAAISTVMNWSAYGGREVDGKFYGQKDREFEPFFDLPRRIERRMQIAVEPPAAIRARLIDGGWEIVDPAGVSRDPWTYQRFIANSRAEFCVAKHGYVWPRSGWFSDRTTAYLASGRPAVVQDAGFTDWIAPSRGLMPFLLESEAVEHLRSLDDGYADRCAAARRLSEQAFDSTLVLGAMLADIDRA